MDELISKAVKLAKDYLKNSYSPYSGVKVASVAITSSGEMFTGLFRFSWLFVVFAFR
jgi:cytidine deaminase